MCRHDSFARTSWGCDEEAEHPVFATTCSRCLGADPKCKRCKGEGSVEYRRCPTALVNEANASSWVDGLMLGYAHYERHQTLPYGGALADQTVAWLDAIAVIEYEIGVIEKARRDEIERQRKAEANRSKAQSGGLRRR